MPETVPVMYGIANCDTIKKARNWLKNNDIEYQFCDYKKQGADENLFQDWLNELGWEKLINKRGTSWRKLDEATRTNMDNELAIKVMLENPSIIKRPLLILTEHKIVGFNESAYQQEFLSA